MWYIIRKEHTLIGMLVPLPEEIAVFTRAQRLLCYYVEIQLALAAVGLFLGTSQTAANAGLVAFISIMVVSPASLFLPYMFTTSQKIVSTTVRISRQSRKARMSTPRKRRYLSGMYSSAGPTSMHPKIDHQVVVPLTMVTESTKSWNTILRQTTSKKVIPLDSTATEQRSITPKQAKGIIKQPSTFAANMLRKKKREVQFNREVRMVEFDYYVKNLHNSRMCMLVLSYFTLASCLALALCKLALPLSRQRDRWQCGIS